MLKNFIWQREDEPQNALSYVFLAINFVYGVVFTFFPHSSTVTKTAFYMASVPPQLWGITVLILVFLTLFTIAKRPKFLGEIMGFWGVVVWGYGLTLYLLTNLWFAGLIIYLPQVIFWAFWYIGVKRFYKKQDVQELKNLKEELLHKS